MQISLREALAMITADDDRREDLAAILQLVHRSRAYRRAASRDNAGLCRFVSALRDQFLPLSVRFGVLISIIADLRIDAGIARHPSGRSRQQSFGEQRLKSAYLEYGEQHARVMLFDHIAISFQAITPVENTEAYASC